MDMNNLMRDEPMHKNDMEKVLEDSNQGIYCYFPFFGTIGASLMATLNILGLNVGIPFWLWNNPNVLNALDASQISTLCHGNCMDVDPSAFALANSTPSPSPPFGEIVATSNQKSKRNKKRKSKKKKSPTFASHIGDVPPATTSHVGSTSPVTMCHTGTKSLTSSSHVVDLHPTSASHVGGKQLASTSHAGTEIPVITSHTGITS
jgi:hypothetical protein